MEIFSWLRFIIGFGLLLIGIIIFALELFGMFRYSYVLNRMHAVAMGDTLGILISISGLIVMEGFTFISFKLALVIVFLWLASPVSSHLIARLEVTTNENIEEHCEVEDNGIL